MFKNALLEIRYLEYHYFKVNISRKLQPKKLTSQNIDFKY